VATGVFGLVGVLGSDKDDERKKQKRKRISMSGVIISASLSLILFGLEGAKATEDSAETIAQFAETQAQLAKSLRHSRELLRDSNVLEDQLTSDSNDLSTMAQKQSSLLQAQSTMLLTENNIGNLQIRSSLPIAPITLRYVESFDSDSPEFSGYRKRLLPALQKRLEEESEDARKRDRFSPPRPDVHIETDLTKIYKELNVEPFFPIRNDDGLGVGPSWVRR
jgi:hypothetical protein